MAPHGSKISAQAHLGNVLRQRFPATPFNHDMVAERVMDGRFSLSDTCRALYVFPATLMPVLRLVVEESRGRRGIGKLRNALSRYESEGAS